MNKSSHHRTPLRSFLLVIAGLLFLTSMAAAASQENVDPAVPPPDWHRIFAVTGENPAAPVAVVPQPPDRDPCLHCHIIGENKGMWTPLGRWTLFGSLGLVFVLGVYRSATVWKTRKPWVPLTTRAAGWVDERYEISEPLSKLLEKPVPKYATRWFYCLGGLTAFLFVVQGITGIMLAFYYQPTPETAFASIQYIENQVRFGSAIRMIHHWASNGMIVLCIAHMLRVFITGAYKSPRERCFSASPATCCPGTSARFGLPRSAPRSPAPSRSSATWLWSTCASDGRSAPTPSAASMPFT